MKIVDLVEVGKDYKGLYLYPGIIGNDLARVSIGSTLVVHDNERPMVSILRNLLCQLALDTYEHNPDIYVWDTFGTVPLVMPEFRTTALSSRIVSEYETNCNSTLMDFVCRRVNEYAERMYADAPCSIPEVIIICGLSGGLEGLDRIERETLISRIRALMLNGYKKNVYLIAGSVPYYPLSDLVHASKYVIKRTTGSVDSMIGYSSNGCSDKEHEVMLCERAKEATNTFNIRYPYFRTAEIRDILKGMLLPLGFKLTEVQRFLLGGLRGININRKPTVE